MVSTVKFKGSVYCFPAEGIYDVTEGLVRRKYSKLMVLLHLVHPSFAVNQTDALVHQIQFSRNSGSCMCGDTKSCGCCLFFSDQDKVLGLVMA